MHSYKTTCPECEGSNLYCTPHNGVKYCFNCGYTEIQRGFHRPQEELIRGPIGEIRQFYAMIANYYHASIDKRARQYLHSRGITDAMIDAYKLGYCPEGNVDSFLYKSSGAKESGIFDSNGNPALANRIIFPYMLKGSVVDLRGRSIDPNEEVRYKSPHGRRYYRGADYPYGADNIVYPHILVEGEIKRIIVESLGFRAVGLPGITIDFKMYQPGKVIICLDSEADDAKQVDVNRSIWKLGAKAVDPYVMTLPLLDFKKMGADDLILISRDEFLLRYRTAVPYDTWKRLVTLI